VLLLVAGGSTTVTRPLDALDWFAAVAPEAPPSEEDVRSALHLAGSGSIVLWLGAATIPDFVATSARSVAAGAVVSAATLAGPEAR
jgi:hypothetical protein